MHDLQSFAGMSPNEYREAIKRFWTDTQEVAEPIVTSITEQVEAERLTPLQGLRLTQAVYGEISGVHTHALDPLGAHTGR